MTNLAYNDNFDAIEELEATLQTARWSQQIEKEPWFREAIQEALDDPNERPAHMIFDELRKKYGLSHC